MATASRQAIDDFLASKRIAIAGVARNPADFSRSLFRDLQSRGYDVVPVNPNAEEIEGLRCFKRVSDIQPPVEAALLFTTGPATDEVVKDCAVAGVKRIWMYRARGRGAVTQNAVNFCLEHGITVVPGECVYMFLPQAGWVHSFHGFLKKTVGAYPR